MLKRTDQDQMLHDVLPFFSHLILRCPVGTEVEKGDLITELVKSSGVDFSLKSTL